MVLEQLDMQNNKCKTKQNKTTNVDGLYTLHENNSKWIIDLNVKYKTIKLLEDNMEKNLDDLGYDDTILDTKPKTWSLKEIMHS